MLEGLVAVETLVERAQMLQQNKASPREAATLQWELSRLKLCTGIL